jgi:hypothetical protein
MTSIILKLKRTAGLLSMISMLVSSVAACACSHHSVPKAESKKSCHSHSESAIEVDSGYQGQIISGTGCSCGQASPRLVFKQDQKQLQVKPAITPSMLVDPEFVAIVAESAGDNFGTRSFSQSFLRNSTLGRAPPRPKFA